MKKPLLTAGFLWLALILSLALGSCGYKFAGNGRLPGGSQSLYVAMFENRTLEMGVEHVFVQAMISELVRRTGVRLANETEAQAYLKGAVTAITLDTLTRASDGSTVERVVRATVDLTLTDQEGNVLWNVSQFAISEEYTVSQENETDEAAKAAGVGRIARRIAERAVSAMTDDF